MAKCEVLMKLASGYTNVCYVSLCNFSDVLNILFKVKRGLPWWRSG